MEQRMPLARYFVWVGGVLLALLVILDASVPTLPSISRAEPILPVIRIYSDRKWPERIVFDTSLPTIVPAQAAPKITIPNAAAIADASAEKGGRKAFAQMRPSEVHPQQSSTSTKREQKLQRQSKVTKRRVAPSMVLVARQAQFGWPRFW